MQKLQTKEKNNDIKVYQCIPVSTQNRIGMNNRCVEYTAYLSHLLEIDNHQY